MRRLRLSALALLLLLALVIPFTAQAAEFRVNNFGAKGDGITPDTAAIQKTIDAAARTHDTIVFSPGVYLTGSVFLKSGTHLRIDKGVEIRGIHDQSAYPVMPTRTAGIEMRWPAALINVYEQSGVTISGEGVIDGDGKLWWDRYWQTRKDYDARGRAGRPTTTRRGRG